MVVLYERKTCLQAGVEFKTSWERVAEFSTKKKAKEYIKRLGRKMKCWEYKYELT